MVKRKLKRQLTLGQIIMLGAAGTIGAQIFVLTGYAAAIAGPAMLLALLAGGLLSYSIALNYCELATTYPVTGGAMTYVREAWGSHLLSFLVGSLDCLSSTFFAALSAVGFAYSLQVVIPGLPIVPTALGVLAGFTALNLLGATQVGRLQIILGVILLTIFGVYIVLGFVLPGGFQPKVLFPQGVVFPHAGFGANAGSILRTIALTYVAFVGFEVIADDAEEVREPNRNIPLGILISLTLVIVINLLTALVTLGTVPWTELAGSGTALTDAARRFLPGWGAPFMAIAGLIATLTTINTAMLSATREAFTLSRDGAWPHTLSRLGRFRTPYLSILLIGLASMLITLTNLVDFLSYISSAGYLFVLFWASLAMLRLRAQHPDVRRPFKAPFFPLTAYAAAGTCLLVVSFTDWRALAFGAALVAAGGAFYYAYRPVTRVVASRVAASERLKNRILIPVASPQTAQSLVRLAASLTQAGRDINLCVLSVAVARRRLPPEGVRQMIERFKSRQKSLLSGIARDAFEKDVPLYIKVRAAPTVAQGILAELENYPDTMLVLMGWPGHHEPADLANTTAKAVLAAAHTNVAVLLDRGLSHIRRVLVPVGGGAHSRLALRLAAALAEQGGGQVTALHTLSEAAPTDHLEDDMASLREVVVETLGEVPGHVTTRIVRAASVATGILQEAQRQPYDLVVAGASAEWASPAHLFGTVDDWLVRRAPCSVLLVRRYEPVAIAWLKQQMKQIGRGPTQGAAPA